MLRFDEYNGTQMLTYALSMFWNLLAFFMARSPESEEIDALPVTFFQGVFSVAFFLVLLSLVFMELGDRLIAGARDPFVKSVAIDFTAAILMTVAFFLYEPVRSFASIGRLCGVLCICIVAFPLDIRFSPRGSRANIQEIEMAHQLANTHA